MLLSQIPAYYRLRRDVLKSKSPKSAFLIAGNIEMYKTADQHFEFRQDSDLYYLTGFTEPDAFLVMNAGVSTLFVRERDALMELWNGERYGVDGAKKVFGVDAAYPIKELKQRLPDLLKGADAVYYRMGIHKCYDDLVLEALESYRRSQGRSGSGLLAIKDTAELVHEMRVIKSDDEIKLMRKASQITAQAHIEAMKQTKPGMMEYEVQAILEYVYRKSGCERNAYYPIVAGGKNATCLHYHFNNEELKEGSLLLIDSAGECGYYASDITRTFPVGRKFSTVQARIYDLVLEANKKAIAVIKPGVRYEEVHNTATKVLAQGLIDLGILKGSVEECIKTAEIKKYYPHGTSHLLGMDVHDVGLYRIHDQSRVLEPGMCFTVEPGLYFQPGDQGYPDEYRGIGIRIEDDIVVTQDGCEVLTKDAPKERAEIEKLRH